MTCRTTQTWRRLIPQSYFEVLGRLHIQNEVHSRPQEVRTVRLGHERVYGIQSTVGQLQVIGQHDYGNLWFDLLHLCRDGRARQKAQFVVQHNRVYRQRHEKLESIGSTPGGYQLVSVLLQQPELAWISMYAQQGVVGSHAGRVYKQAFRVSVQNCSMNATEETRHSPSGLRW